MSGESENKRSFLSNPELARRVFWVTVGVVAWFVLMLFGLEMSLGDDSHGGGALMLPFVVLFVVVACGCTFAIPNRFPVARSIVSLFFLLVATIYAGGLTGVVLF